MSKDAIILNGRIISNFIYEECKRKINILKDDYSITPSLSILSFNNDYSSKIYVDNIMKKGLELNVNIYNIKIKDYINQEDLMKILLVLNTDKDIDGILLTRPIPDRFNYKELSKNIYIDKDIDCLNSLSLSKIFNKEQKIIPCTINAIFELLNYYHIPLTKKHIVIINRSINIGKPLSLLLMNCDYTVTVCNSLTEDLDSICKLADILIVGIGHPNFINMNYIKDKAIVIDLGINDLYGKLTGDVDFDIVKQYTSYITPVPNGVGSVTIASIFKNLIKLTIIQNNIEIMEVDEC